MIEILTYAWHIFSNEIKYITLLAVPFTLLAFPSYFISQPTEDKIALPTIIGLIIYLIGFSMYLSTLIFFMSQKYRNKLEPVKSNIINGLVYAPLLMITLVIANSPIIAACIIIFSSMSLQFIALPLFILGIYISLKTTFAPFHLILEGYKPLAAIRCSFYSTNGKVVKIILVSILFYFFSSLVESLTNFKTRIEPFNVLIFFIGVAVTMLMVAIQQIAVFKLYINSFEQIAKEIID